MRRAISAVVIFGLLAGAKVTLPDVRGGNIGGQVALLYWPATMPASEKQDSEPLSTAHGCEVHLVPHTDAHRELRYPCGKWFAPPVDAYNVWLETDGGITPNPVMTRYGGSPFQGQGLAAITPVAPAGRIAIPANRAMSEREDLRLLSLESGDWWNRSARLFDRRVSALDAKTAVQMPQGRVLVGRFDRTTNDAVALARPVQLKKRETVRVWPEAPSASDVLLVLDKPRELQQYGSPSPRVSLNGRAPDVFIDSFERIIAVWYGVDARMAKLSLQSDVAFWPGQETRLVPGKVTTIRSRLQRLPSASVSILAPPDAVLPSETTLIVSRASDEKTVHRRRVSAGVHDVRGLPAEPMRFTLQIGEWNLVRNADLSAASDERVTFELQPLVISGTVFYGDDPAPAEIEFFDGGQWATKVQTDDRGRYRTTLWWPKTHSLRLTLAGAEVPPFVESFRDVFESGTVDIHIPRTDYIVRVRDATSGRGIAAARVSAGNLWLDEASRERASSAQVVADDEGRAVLPPLQPGEVIIEAEAERYAKIEPLRLRVDDEHHELEIALRPLRGARRVQLFLPNGTPANDAEIWAFSEAMQPVWRGNADGDGAIEIPQDADGAWLLVRHRNAATSVRRWTSNEANPAWTLDAPAEPLTVVVEHAGGTLASSAHVVLWLDGVKLSGVPLTFATWSAPATGAAGEWVARNLPPRPVRVLALPSEEGGAIATNAYDAVGVTVDYPWPARVTATTAR
jgi:hypothetical protein